MRTRKPCVFLRFLVFGWNVRFTVAVLLGGVIHHTAATGGTARAGRVYQSTRSRPRRQSPAYRRISSPVLSTGVENPVDKRRSWLAHAAVPPHTVGL